MSVDAIINRCEQLYDDLEFTYVKDWKERNKAKAIGYMPVYVPRELIHAAGMLPVGIMGGGNNMEIIRGDAFFQSYICRIPRSTIELGLTGRLDELDGMLFPAICDVIRNLSGMWQMMFEGKYIKYLDVPQNYGEQGRRFYRTELEDMAQAFERISGNRITTNSLNNSIELYNENRSLVADLYDLRSEQPHKVLTSELYLLMRASNIMEVSEHSQLLRDYLVAVGDSDRNERDHVRVVVTGTFCEQPPLSLVRGMENSGCFIVDDDWVLVNRYQTEAVTIGDNPMDALIEAYLGKTVSTASRYDETTGKGEFLIDQVKRRNAEGVIFAAASFCDPALLDRPMVQDALTRENIPYTSFKYAENTGQIQVIKEQTGTFADSIKLWGNE
jgi:benzoyl-CoA reductase subunit C